MAKKQLEQFTQATDLKYTDWLHRSRAAVDNKLQVTDVVDLVQADLFYDTLAELIAETDAEKVKAGKRVVTFANQNGAAVRQEWEIVPNLTGTADGFKYINLTGSSLQAKQVFANSEEYFKKAGAIGDGVADDTAAVLAVQNSGFFVVGKNTGKFRVTAPLAPQNWQIWHLGTGLIDPSNGVTDKGCVFHIDHGAGNLAVNAVTMSHSSALIGCTFYYPNQAAQTATTPVVYGTTIVSAAGITDNIRLEDITLYNSYRGIDLVQCGRFYVNNIQGNPLQMGIHVDNCFDVCRMENIHFWSFYTQTNTLENWMRDNLIAFDFDRVDDLKASKLFTWQPNIALRLGSDLWGTIDSFTCDKARTYGIFGDGATKVQMTNAHLIMDENVRPAVFIDNGGTFNFSNLTVADGTSNVGVQINGGEAVNIANYTSGSTHAPVICLSTTTKVNINGYTSQSGVPVLGYNNVKINGVPLLKTGTELTLPAPTLSGAVESPVGTFTCALTTAGVQQIVFDTYNLTQRCGLYVLRFGFVPPSTTTYYFKIRVEQDTGANNQFAIVPLSPMQLNGGGIQIHVPFTVNWTKFKQQIKIEVESTDTSVAQNVVINDIRLFEQLDIDTTDDQIDLMLREYHVDAYGKGKTRGIKGGKMLLTAESEVGVGRSNCVPAGNNVQGDEAYEIVPAVDGNNMMLTHYKCITSGSPGTWLPIYQSTVTPAV